MVELLVIMNVTAPAVKFGVEDESRELKKQSQRLYNFIAQR